MNPVDQSRQPEPDNSREKLKDIIPLLKEREKYIQWLTKLEDKKDGYSEKIYSKLKEEYSSKLAPLDSKLVRYQPSAESRIKELKKKHDKATDLVSSLEEDIQEEQLRFAVEEISKDKLSQIEQEKSDQIQNCKNQLEVIFKEIGHLEDIIKVITEAARNRDNSINYNSFREGKDYSF